MNSSEYVMQLIADQKAAGTDPQLIAWNAALACVDWPYVFGARGEYCTPANRRARYREQYPTIKSRCKNFEGTGSCSGCKWYPNGKKVRFFDCRGFTYAILLWVYEWKLMGAGATSQWNTETNWKAKGKISDGIPADTLVCLFYSKDNKEKTWEHTGFGFNNETVECGSNVQHFTTRNKKWTHWAIPACIGGEIPTPTPTPTPSTDKPTLHKGDRGEYVTLMQSQLINKGYSCGSCGADGKFGNDTLYALKKFQLDAGLQMDGVCGPNTWAALESTKPAVQTYTVHIPCMPKYKAEALINQYSGSWMTAEGSDSE